MYIKWYEVLRKKTVFSGYRSRRIYHFLRIEIITTTLLAKLSAKNFDRIEFPSWILVNKYPWKCSSTVNINDKWRHIRISRSQTREDTMSDCTHNWFEGGLGLGSERATWGYGEGEIRNLKRFYYTFSYNLEGANPFCSMFVATFAPYKYKHTLKSQTVLFCIRGPDHDYKLQICSSFVEHHYNTCQCNFRTPYCRHPTRRRENKDASSSLVVHH